MNENDCDNAVLSRLPSEERGRTICIESLKKQCLEIFNDSDKMFNLFTVQDPHLRNTDTVRGVVLILNKYRDLCQNFILIKPNEREEMFNFIYNCTIFVHQFCIRLKTVSRQRLLNP
jgi:hypothetical protein